jgi:hypothetical protein
MGERVRLLKKMPRVRYALIILIGLSAAQILFTIGVCRSNAALYAKLALIKKAGYLPIPNQTVMATLHDFGPAFSGGLFFTLTAGVGLTLLAMVAAWIWDHLFNRNKIILGLYLIFWAGALTAANCRGCCPMTTSYFILIPAGVFWAALKWLPFRTRKTSRPNQAISLLPVTVLAFFWISQWNGQLFVSFRDHFLLSNSFGMKISDGYYRYNLYAAEVFKSLHQKILKTCTVENITHKALESNLKEELIRNDYLPVREDRNVDLRIKGKGNFLVFLNDGKPILRLSLNDFFSNSEIRLKEFSRKSDRHAFFRHFVFFSLLIALPLMCYMILYGLLRFLSGLFMTGTASTVITSFLCLVIGIALLVPLHKDRSGEIRIKDLAETLKSSRWQDRAIALKIAGQQGIEVADLSGCQELFKSPHILERYWLARALGFSRKQETFKDLLVLLDDPHPNVVCMAFHALGQRGERRAVKEIINRMERSDHWYEQWYAYKALRSMGWKQKSN